MLAALYIRALFLYDFIRQSKGDNFEKETFLSHIRGHLPPTYNIAINLYYTMYSCHECTM